MNLKFALLTPLFFGGVLSAATIVQTENYGFIPDGTQALTFNQFDTSLGILTGITITTNVNKTGGSLFVDNESAIPASGNIQQSVSITLTSGLVAFTDAGGFPIGNGVSAVSSYFANVQGDDGDGPGFQNTGPDFDGTAFGPVANSDTGNVGAAFFGGYEGTGTFIVNTDGSQGFNTSAIGGAAVQIVPASVGGDVTITYTYTATPEPTTSLLGGLALGLLALRRRR